MTLGSERCRRLVISPCPNIYVRGVQPSTAAAAAFSWGLPTGIRANRKIRRNRMKAMRLIPDLLDELKSDAERVLKSIDEAEDQAKKL